MMKRLTLVGSTFLLLLFAACTAQPSAEQLAEDADAPSIEQAAAPTSSPVVTVYRAPT